MNKKLKQLAKNLKKTFPRSPRETLGGYVLAARALDKCRAELAKSQGDYHFDCPLDRVFFDFAEIDSKKFKTFVSTGATDAAVAEWIVKHAKPRPRIEVIKWNNHLREMRLSDLPDETMEFMEDYIRESVPKGKPIYVWFDVFDLEEKRLK